jgi:hypothetical protein
MIMVSFIKTKSHTLLRGSWRILDMDLVGYTN